MNKIVSKEHFSANVVKLEVEAPLIARSRKAEELLIGKKVSELHTCKEEFLDAWNTVISPHAMPEYRRNTTRRMLAFFIDALEAGHAPGRVDIQE